LEQIFKEQILFLVVALKLNTYLLLFQNQRDGGSQISADVAANAAPPTDVTAKPATSAATESAATTTTTASNDATTAAATQRVSKGPSGKSDPLWSNGPQNFGSFFFGKTSTDRSKVK
jgi:hypothetical protein